MGVKTISPQPHAVEKKNTTLKDNPSRLAGGECQKKPAHHPSKQK